MSPMSVIIKVISNLCIIFLQLNLHGVPITEEEAISTDVKFLDEIMEKYEKITSDDKKAKEVYQENNGMFVPFNTISNKFRN